MKKMLIFLVALCFALSAQAAPAQPLKAKKEQPKMRVEDGIKFNATSADKQVMKPQIDVVCIQSAIDKRESAVISALDKKALAIKSALEQRRTDLKAAWGIWGSAKEGLNGRTKARLEAWKKFRAAETAVRADYRKAVKSAWQQYKTDKKSCRNTESDNESSGTDNSL